MMVYRIFRDYSERPLTSVEMARIFVQFCRQQLINYILCVQKVYKKGQ